MNCINDKRNKGKRRNNTQTCVRIETPMKQTQHVHLQQTQRMQHTWRMQKRYDKYKQTTNTTNTKKCNKCNAYNKCKKCNKRNTHNKYNNTTTSSLLPTRALTTQACTRTSLQEASQLQDLARWRKLQSVGARHPSAPLTTDAPLHANSSLRELAIMQPRPLAQAPAC